MKISKLILILMAILFVGCKEDQSDASKITVGVIRWDAWFGVNNEFMENLAPQKWNQRWPFYTTPVPFTVRADAQQVMDQEIEYASQAGLSYWAFVYYYGQPVGTWNNGLELYLSSSKKNLMKFSLLLQGSHLGDAANWDNTVQVLKNYMQQSQYQKTPEGKALVYVYDIESLLRIFNGNKILTRQKLQQLKVTAHAYLVAQVWDAGSAARYINDLGFDAAGSYSNLDSQDRMEKPYGVLAQANQNYWEACRKRGLQVVPTVSTGWDPTPRWERQGEKWDSYGVWYSKATPEEIANNLASAISWIKNYSSQSEARTVLIYAWNEYDEGGWLAPTLAEGNARLESISRILK